MPHVAPRWTAEMVRGLPEDGNRYEVIAGERFVTLAPSYDHQEAVAAACFADVFDEPER